MRILWLLLIVAVAIAFIVLMCVIGFSQETVSKKTVLLLVTGIWFSSNTWTSVKNYVEYWRKRDEVLQSNN